VSSQENLGFHKNMTEKDYSGVTTSKIGKNAQAKSNTSQEKLKAKETSRVKQDSEDKQDSDMNAEAYKKAGEILKKTREFAKALIKPGLPLLEIANKIEAKILDLGGELAFPVNLSIDEVAAHYTPTPRDETPASGLLKVDLGIHIKGYIADSAFSMDLTPDKKYKKLIEASEHALKAALDYVKAKKENAVLSEIGKEIQNVIEKQGFAPVRNLSGHGLGKFDIHSGLTIPNYENNNLKTIGEGAFAIEPFATTGSGIIYDGAGSGIYHLSGDGQVRDQFSREVFAFIVEEKKTLPFSQRELERKFGSRILFAISNLKRAGIIEEYAQLVEKNHSPVSQAEHSFIIHDGKVEVITE